MKNLKKKILLFITLSFSVILLVGCNINSPLNQAKKLLEIDLLDNNSLDEIRTNINLPKNLEEFSELTITWESDNLDVITTTDVVTRTNDDIKVALTATLRIKNDSTTKKFNLTVIGTGNDLLADETYLLIEEDIKAFKSIDVINLEVQTPTTGLINNSSITWTFKSPNITKDGLVIPNNIIENSNIGTATARFTINGFSKSYDFEFEIPITENIDITNVKSIPFKNLTSEYNLAATSLNIYHNEDAFVPYVSILEFVHFLKGLIDPSIEFTSNINSGILELKYNYYDSLNDELIELVLEANSNTNVLSTNDSGFFSGFIESTTTNFSRNINYDLNSELTHFQESNGYELNLGNYGFNIINYDDDVLIPFYVANLLFANSNYYSVYYNGETLTGVYFIPSADSVEGETILNTSLNGSSIPNDLLIHNFNFLAFFFDNFYGLKDYQKIDTYYDILLEYKNNLINNNARIVDNAIFKFINKDIDELHTYFGLKSYYQTKESNGPEIQFIDDFGTNTFDYYINGLYAIDGVIGNKWNIRNNNNWNAYHSLRENYWVIDNEILVFSLDDFDTADIIEDNIWDNNIINDILDTNNNLNILPDINFGNRFIYFNTSSLDVNSVEVFIKDATINDYYNYKLLLENNGFIVKEKDFYKFYTKTTNNVTYTLDINYDSNYEVFYLALSNESFYDDIESLILSDSAIYLEFELTNILKKYPNIEHAILDITWNMGGNVGALYRVIGLLFNKPFTVSNFDPTLDQQSTYLVEIDAPVTFEHLDWSLLTSPVSFSAANMMATIVKQNNLAPILGQKSGGGAASVIPVYLPIGTIFASSSSNVSALVTGDNTKENPYQYLINEGGIIPDVEIPLNLIYNDDYLKNIILND